MEDKILKAIGEQKELIESKVGEVKDSVDSIETRLKEVEGKVSKRKIDLPGVEDEKDEFSFFRAIKGITTGNWDGAGFEKEIHENTKDMSVGSDGAGGYLVPAQVLPGMIEMLKAKSTVISAGATVLEGLSGSPVEIPRQTGGATGYWVGENASITPSDLTLDQLSMNPKQASAMVKLSNRLLKLSNPAAEGLVRRDIVSTIALLIDLAALRGTGASNQPLGIANTSGINTVALGTNGDAFEFDDINAMAYALDEDNALNGNLGFITHPKVIQKLKDKRITQFTGDLTGAPVVLSDNDLVNQTGYSWNKTTQLPKDLVKGSSSDCTEVYFGNWEELIIGMWGGMELMASKETSDAFAKNQMWVRVIQDVDVAVRHAESFCLISDARTN